MSLEAATELLSVLAEPTRVRLLALLERSELSVAELVAVTDLGQSRVSMHLAKLLAAGLLRDRRQGTSTRYALADGMPEPAASVWRVLRGSAKGSVLARDGERLDALLRARREGEPWHDALAGEMERHYSPGRTWESLARGLVGLVSLGDVLDVGSGDGALAELLGPQCKSITCVDKSDKMVSAAKKRLARFDEARVVRGEAEALPLADASFDVALAFNVLVFVKEPSLAIAEAARVLRKDGTLAVVTLAAHDHHAIAQSYGHAHAGLSAAALKRAFSRAGLVTTSCEVTSRERREPHLSVITAFATKPRKSAS